MKKLIILLFSALSLTAFAQEKPKLAVYMTGNDPVNEIVANRLVDDFASGNRFITMERTSSFLAELSKEHAYERSGEVDDDQIAALGKQFKVQYVCVASVFDVWESEKYISARIIDVETAEVVASGSSNGSLRNSTELISALNSLSSNFLKAMDSYKKSDAKKVAVYVSKTGNRDVDIVLGDQMVAGFAKSGRYVAIERTNSFLSKLKDEQGYQQSGSVDDSDLTKWGQQFGVKYVCVLKTTAWSGDYFISARMIDVVTGEVVNSYKIEGRRLANSQDVVVTAQEIAANLSKGTFAEQAEEARLAEEARRKAAEEARLAEEARRKAAEEARIKAEEERRRAEEEQQRKHDAMVAAIEERLNQGYVIVDTEKGKYMIDLEIGGETSFKDANITHSKYGYSGWRLPTKDEEYKIFCWFKIEERYKNCNTLPTDISLLNNFENFLWLCYAYKNKTLMPFGKYWCTNEDKFSWYFYYGMKYLNNQYKCLMYIPQHGSPDEREWENNFTSNAFTYVEHVKSGITARTIYLRKM